MPAYDVWLDVNIAQQYRFISSEHKVYGCKCMFNSEIISKATSIVLLSLKCIEKSHHEFVKEETIKKKIIWKLWKALRT